MSTTPNTERQALPSKQMGEVEDQLLAIQSLATVIVVAARGAEGIASQGFSTPDCFEHGLDVLLEEINRRRNVILQAVGYSTDEVADAEASR